MSGTIWDSLREAFVGKYENEDSPGRLWEQLLHLHQQDLHDYSSYEAKLENMWGRWAALLGGLEMAPECPRKDRFLVGLFAALREKVKANVPDTFEEALPIARAKERKMRYRDQAWREEDLPTNVQAPLMETMAQGAQAQPIQQGGSSPEELMQRLTE